MNIRICVNVLGRQKPNHEEEREVTLVKGDGEKGL